MPGQQRNQQARSTAVKLPAAAAAAVAVAAAVGAVGPYGRPLPLVEVQQQQQ